jgi:hypothetical protein
MKSPKIGDWIYVNNPNHRWHGERMKVTDIEKGVLFEVTKYRVQSASGISSTFLLEGELSFSPPGTKLYFGHDGHEVIENEAGGKKFLYCRKCKVEVT